MKINKNVIIELSPDDVKEIIVKYLETNGYKAKVEDVCLKTSSHLEGMGYAEHEVISFDGAYIKVNGDK